MRSHVGRSVLIGTVTPNRNGRVPPVVLESVIACPSLHALGRFVEMLLDDITQSLGPVPRVPCRCTSSFCARRRAIAGAGTDPTGARPSSAPASRNPIADSRQHCL